MCYKKENVSNKNFFPIMLISLNSFCWLSSSKVSLSALEPLQYFLLSPPIPNVVVPPETTGGRLQIETISYLLDPNGVLHQSKHI